MLASGLAEVNLRISGKLEKDREHPDLRQFYSGTDVTGSSHALRQSAATDERSEAFCNPNVHDAGKLRRGHK
jgi:hypothetical protein